MSLSQLHRVLRLLFARYFLSQKSFCIDDLTVFKKENNASVCLFEWVARWGKGGVFFFFLHFNVLMQPMEAMRHSILSTYIDTHRVVPTMYVVWKKLSA